MQEKILEKLAMCQLKARAQLPGWD